MVDYYYIDHLKGPLRLFFSFLSVFFHAVMRIDLVLFVEAILMRALFPIHHLQKKFSLLLKTHYIKKCH